MGERTSSSLRGEQRVVKCDCSAPASVLRQIVAEVEEARFRARPLLAEAGVVHLSRARRIPWPAFARFLEGLREACSPDEFREISVRTCRSQPLLRMLGRLAPTPESLYCLAISAAGPAWPFVRFALREQRDGSIVIDAALDRECVPCGAFFLAMAHALRALPSLIGLPDADLLARVSPGRASYRVRPSERRPTRSLGKAWLGRRGRSAAASARSALVLVVASLGALALDEAAPDRGQTRMISAVRARGLTAAEAQVACKLVDGLVPREIARDLEVSLETVRTHLKRAYSKLGVHRQSELVRVVLDASAPASDARQG